MKENRVSNEFRQGREATFAALLMELCLCGERIASIMGIRNWYDQVGTVRIFLCILIFCYPPQVTPFLSFYNYIIMFRLDTYCHLKKFF